MSEINENENTLEETVEETVEEIEENITEIEKKAAEIDKDVLEDISSVKSTESEEKKSSINRISPENDLTYSYSYTKRNQRKGSGFLGKLVTGLFIFLLAFAGGYGGSYLYMKTNPVEEKETVIYHTVNNVVEDTTGEKTPVISYSPDYSVSNVAEKTSESVVEIITEVVQYSIWMQQYVTSGSGSGVIISEDGYIVTCNHVIENAKSITVTLTDGKSYEAELVGVDTDNDIAVIKIDAVGLKPVTYGSSDDLIVGEHVVAIGNPLGTLGGTVTTGIISAKDREINVEGTNMTLIQTDTAVNPGNSGGALFNMDGKLVGVVNAKSSGSEIEGLGFAIPIDSVKDIINDLVTKGYVSGKRSLGLSIITIYSKRYADYYGVDEYGLYVGEIKEHSIAEEAGFELMDRIVSINNISVTDFNELESIYLNITKGSMVEFVVDRKGEEIKIRFEKE